MPNTLTVGQLVRQLQKLDPDLPVLLAINPDWPFAHTIGRLLLGAVPEGPAVYIAESGQHDYLSGEMITALSWGAA
ncbi:hypothetical protein [Streptomyces sp. G1]|uniref:hypothetical protein n=1 Tax=Streptomyces sp. G1 TaxID=361572 RepID=UPI0020301FBC|nr:hypothetical protein [Streptomyces sp. G1]MCM1967983.1 hypothetical protein [Streptomyces sp. G1]